MDNYNIIKKVTLVNIISNVILSIAKIVSGSIFYSPALISDGFHSISDLVTDVAVIFSFKLSNKPKDKSHPYGHGKIEHFANFFIAAVLITAAVNISISSYNAIKHNIKIEPSILNLVIAVFSVILKEVLYHINKNTGKKINNKPLVTNAWHHRTDAVTSLAVFMGIILGLINEKLIIADPIVSFIVSAMIIYIGVKILYTEINLMIDRNIDNETEERIKKLVNSQDDVISLHNLRGRYYGGKIIIDLHIQLEPNIHLHRAHEITHKVQEIILKNNPQIIEVIIHTEPYNSE
ncbi:cation diffusion facilitator family transporter [Spirochaetota bacterium]